MRRGTPSSTWRTLTVVLMGMATASAGCIKPRTFSPYANPGRDELDRLQKIVNQRPDLETVEHQLADLDAVIRASVAKHSPAEKFSSTPVLQSTNGCNNPFERSIGRQVGSDSFAIEPAPSRDQWTQIATELAPIFSAAGFHQNDLTPGEPPRPPSADDDSQIRDDMALINFVNGGNLVMYSYNTGCHLPAACPTAGSTCGSTGTPKKPR